VTLKVLVPLDGSDVSDRALLGALRLLKGRSGLEVTLFNAVSPGMEDAPPELVAKFDADEDDEIFPTTESAERMLERAEKVCMEHDIPSQRRIVTGPFVDSILAACKEHDLLVMHRLERRQLKETLRGSRTEHLARRAGIDVLLVQTD
jgi:nucleotide-binding universal stress UspA family protein